MERPSFPVPLSVLGCRSFELARQKTGDTEGEPLLKAYVPLARPRLVVQYQLVILGLAYAQPAELVAILHWLRQKDTVTKPALQNFRCTSTQCYQRKVVLQCEMLLSECVLILVWRSMACLGTGQTIWSQVMINLIDSVLSCYSYFPSERLHR